MTPLLDAGLNLTAIGMGVVFTLLTLLVGIIRGMSAVSRRLEAAFGAGAAAAADHVTAEPRNEIVSVIAAAIAAYRKKHQG